MAQPSLPGRLPGNAAGSSDLTIAGPAFKRCVHSRIDLSLKDLDHPRVFPQQP
jgi:hypothetical protein